MNILFIQAIGSFAAVISIFALLWSFFVPNKRLWPPKRYDTVSTIIFVWLPTTILSITIIYLGLIGWNTMEIPAWIRFGLGVPLFILGNIIVWYEVTQFGIHQTGGAVGQLRTSGFYKYSRNPQYLADIFIVTGWLLWSASFAVILVSMLVIIILLLAPLPEEHWLESVYKNDYLEYKKRIPRFIGFIKTEERIN